MKNLIFIWVFLVAGAWSQDCKVVETMEASYEIKGVEAGKDTSATILLKGKPMVCMDNGQLRRFLDGKDECEADLDTAKSIIGLLDLRKEKSDSAFNLIAKSDSIMLSQTDTLRKVIAYSDSIRKDLNLIRSINENQLERCEDSKMTFMEKVTLSIAIFFLGGLTGAVAF